MLSLVASARHSREKGWFISHKGARIALENMNDFLTVYDIYVNHHYDTLESLASANSIVWDIGANLGATCLIFAQNPRIRHVYAFEPMPETVVYARRSLDANPELSAKVTLESLGIGSSDGEMQVNYTAKAKCAIGISEIPPRLKWIGGIKSSDLHTIKVPLIDANRVLRSIRNRHPDAQILLKIDAEGAEYQIISRLAETGALAEISAAAIEWHLSPGKDFLISRLASAGFTTEAIVLEKDGSIGMINAWRIDVPLSR